MGRKSFALETAPVIHLGCPAVRKVYEELGAWTQLKRERKLIDGMVHWVLPEHRLDVQPTMKNFDDETQREWPDDPVAEAWDLRERWTEAVDQLFDEVLGSEGALVADGFWARRFLNRVSGQLPDRKLDELEPLDPRHPLRGGARAVEPWVTDLTPRQLGKAAALRIAGLWGRGPEDRDGGLPSLRQQLLGKIKLKSGEMKPGLRVAEVLFKRGKITGISLLGKKDRYGCDHMLIAANPLELIDASILAGELPKSLATALSAIRPAASRFVLHLEINERGLSPALDGTAICIPADDPDGYSFVADHGVGLTYLRTGGAGEDGMRRVSITRMVAADAPLHDMREQILDELEIRGVLPFARDHIRLVHSPHDGREATDGNGNAIAEFGTETAMRLAMKSIYQYDREPTLGVGLLPHSSGVKNLYFASRLTLPGLGLEGEFAAGLAAAGMVAASTRAPLGRAFLGRP